MCGIAGFYERNPTQPLASLVRAMTATIAHRGPDDDGVWVDEAEGLALGHRRLAILDLTAAGHQPMVSADGRFVLVFNGEIYNHAALRKLLPAMSPHWRGSSDTETILECFSSWGLERTLVACHGMFALALWDRTEKKLTIARDRMGEKPLYYGWQEGSFLFGSELKALKSHPSFRNEVDRASLCLYLRHNCIPAPYSIFVGIQKLRPGSYLTLTQQDLNDGDVSIDQLSFWDLEDAISAGRSSPFEGNDKEAADALEGVLSSSICRQMVSDVPLGSFLSGGVDSSAVVALMQAGSSKQVKTFTIGSTNSNYDEAGYARAVAGHLGTDHTELYLRPEDGLDIVSQLPSMYCEPFADSSQIPTFLVSRLASKHVNVALSGDGGDELFGGYNRYLNARTVWSKLSALPTPVRGAAAAGLRKLSPTSWDALFQCALPFLPSRFHVKGPGEKAHKLADVLKSEGEHAYYRRLTSQWEDPSMLVVGGVEPMTLMTDRGRWPETGTFTEWMMALDTLTYLPDDILVKVDRAAMAVSLETRVPMLDLDVVNFAWSLPLEKKVRGDDGKWLLRQVLYRHVPKELIERPKMGFGFPLDEWLRGPLREWAETLLSEDRMGREGFFHAKPIRDMWAEHLSGKWNRQHQLWPVLMFQAWLDDQ
jgi:asparagine synthase (glutamine-hydrolysing)